MYNSDETKRQKAKLLRYKKPIVKDICLDTIKGELYQIGEECDNVKWYWDTDEETLINALDGDEDEAYEFRMMFSDLCSDCEQMQEDLRNEYVPQCFDLFFVAIGAGNYGGGLLGWDSYEQDYYGLQCTDIYAEEKASKRLKQLTKDEIIGSAHVCLKIYHSYLGIRHRYDCLKASMDILKDQNTGYLQMVKRIEEIYEKANAGRFYDFGSETATKELDRLANNMPVEAWIQ